MGNSQSQSVQQTIDVFNSSMVSSFSQTNNTTAIESRIQQNITLNINSEVHCETLDLIQTGSVTSDLSSQFSLSNSQEVEQQIKSTLDSMATSNNKYVSGFLNTSIANSQNSTTTIVQHAKNIVTANISNIVNNICVQNTSVIQDQTININYPIYSKKCNFQQQAQLFVVSNCVCNSILDIFASDSILSANAANAAVTNDSENSGPIGEIAKLLSGIFSIYGIIAIVFIIGIVFIVSQFFRGAGSIFNRSSSAKQPNSQPQPQQSKTT